jgi:ketosteroid isomerase-like protein
MSADSTIKAARDFVSTWAAVFNSRQTDALTDLYAEDALLHGTSQAKLYVGREQIRSYFRGTSSVAFTEQHFVALSDDSVLVVGKYNFTRVQDGRPLVVPARFTLVVRRQNDIWQVLHHHSSAEPA